MEPLRFTSGHTEGGRVDMFYRDSSGDWKAKGDENRMWSQTHYEHLGKRGSLSHEGLVFGTMLSLNQNHNPETIVRIYEYKGHSAGWEIRDEINNWFGACDNCETVDFQMNGDGKTFIITIQKNEGADSHTRHTAVYRYGASKYVM